MSANRLMVAGETAELEGIDYLRALGYWAERGGQGIYSPLIRERLQGTRSTLRWWCDVQCGIPGRHDLVHVDVKSRMPWRNGPDVSIEISPLMLAISGVTGWPTMFMYGRNWAPATKVWESILPSHSGHCCDLHHSWARAASPDDANACLRVIQNLPEKCRPTRGSEDPYVWVNPSCFVPIPKVR
jgi:hypothetical protein